MRFSSHAVLFLVAVAAVLDGRILVEAKKPPSRAAAGRRPPSRSGGPKSNGGRAAPVSKRRYEEEEEDEEEDDFGFDDPFEEEEDDVGDDEYDEDVDDMPPPARSKRGPPPSKKGSPPPQARNAKRSSPGGNRKRPSGARSPDEDEDYRPRRPSGGRNTSRGGPPPRRGSRGPGGRVIPYDSEPVPGAFTKGIAAFRKSMPDPTAVREAAVNSLNVARETTSSLSSNLYREVKGLTSSELEQVMLKATRPDDTAVKGKHVERLVGVTYQISARYDIYDAVLRKLWSKMTEKDWRTTIKSLYILHRFSADGAPEHSPSLKARLRELRRTKDPKRKDKYFNSKQLLSGDNKPETIKFRAFMSRYAHYVLLRAQCFGGMFDEISSAPAPVKDKKKPTVVKPITSTSLRAEHLDAAAMLLKAGVACQLKEGEECENTAIAAERVASDLIGLTAAVAIALNRALKGDDLKGANPALIKRWCEFYSEDLLPQTRAMVKKTSSKLDAYGLFLPSRMGASVSQDVLQKGLKLEEGDGAVEKISAEEEPAESTEGAAADEEESEAEKAVEDEPEAEAGEEEPAAAAAAKEEGDEYDEYEYEEEEYYDDEEPF